jgi:DNA-binding response OmpR family regulator
MEKKPKILLIDSDAEFAGQTKKALEDGGFQVVVLPVGAEAANKVRFEEPDAIVLDTMLEKHDTGFTVTKTLKADPVYRRIPILMISSAKEKTGMEFSQEADGYWMKTDDFMAKPVSPEEVVNRVKNLLSTAKAA